MKANIKIEAENVEQILTGLRYLINRIKEGKTKGEWKGEINMNLEIIEL